jgi:RNA polymerase sigma-70 factor (ECF subfamily)
MDQQNIPEPELQPLLPRNEDRHAQFLALFLASEREVFRYICALVPCVNDAQDLLQQTALALWRKFDDYNPSRPFTPWACRFALLEAKEYLRRNRKWHPLLENELVDDLVRRREILAVEMDRRFSHLAGCLDKLPGRQRSIVEGYYYQRHPVEKLAAAADRTVEAIYKSLQRIRQALLDCVTAAMGREEAQP